MENNMMGTEKITSRIMIWSGNPTSGYIHKELKAGKWDICIPMFITALFVKTVTKNMKATCPGQCGSVS